MICITELRGNFEDIILIPDLKDTLVQQGFYYTYWNSATPNAGLYGTAFFSKIPPLEVIENCGYLNDEGRTITAIFTDLIVITVYSPTLDLELTEDRITKRKQFDENLKRHTEELKQRFKNKPIMMCVEI